MKYCARRSHQKVRDLSHRGMNGWLSKNKITILLIAILMALALVTRFWHLDRPDDVVFDEVHFGKFISYYFTGEYFFDIHPPVGKLLIAGTAALFGYRPNHDPALLFDHIGEPLDPDAAFALRFLPALAGTALVVLVFFLVRALGASPKPAFFAGTLAALDNALVVQSRFAFLDAFMLSFGLVALIAAFTAVKSSGSKRFFLTASAGAAAGLALSVKMTGALFGAIIILLFFIDAVMTRRFLRLLKEAVILGVLALMIYTIPFAVHFKLLPKSGPGNAFMTPEFNAALLGSNPVPDAEPSNFIEKFAELNITMYRANAGLTADHFNGSKWYEWPIMRRPVWYWSKEKMGGFANIYFLGNPLTWLLVVVSIPIALWLLKFGRLPPERRIGLALLLSGYFLNLALFLFVNRVAFLYHYLPSLVLGILLTGLTFESLNTRLKQFSVKLIYLALLAAFLAVSPLTYGFFLSPGAYKAYQMFTAFFG